MSFESNLTSVRVGATVEQSFLRQVFAWMFAALALSTGIAIWFHSSHTFTNYVSAHTAIVWVAFIAQIGLVVVLGAAINRLPVAVMATLFFLYAGITGAVFSILLAAFTTSSVIGAFAGATGVFGGMAVFGYTTRRDLSGLRPILFGALIGIIAASVVYMFVGGSTFNLIIGWGGVLLFSALTAYDMQKLKGYAAQGVGDSAAGEKLAIYGALSLYLDFVNLFISLLRIFGNSR